MRITIKDIARMGSTSIATVSRVLNGKPGVSQITRLRIQEIIDQTGYRPSLVAQNLALRKSLHLGFVASNLVNSFYVDLFRQIEKLTRNEGYHLLLMDSEQDIEHERENIKLMRQHQVQGLIIVPVHDYDESTDVDHLLRLKLSRFPFVIFGKVDGYGFDCVTTEERDAAAQLTRHLLDYGHRRFAFVGDHPNNRCVRERIQGVRDALAERGLHLPQQAAIPMDDIWFDR
ncbi:MAG TPA: LacI family DNA-binding transcriptional regulator, partial [bacterium]|nr:LacI family DNA-binding transcriptional regulator [bacterium]